MYSQSDKVKSHAEVLHTDTCNKAGEPDSYPLDGTICNNITIKNCKFINVNTGLGNHVASTTKSTSYKVIGNTFKNIHFYCMDLCDRSNVILRSNTLVNTSDMEGYVRVYESTISENDHPEYEVTTDTSVGYD